MDANKRIGIWMDHSAAHLVSLIKSEEIQIINSKFDFEMQDEAKQKSENLMHNKRQQMLAAFYKEIAAEILKYDHVLLFGPTNARVELHNYIKKDLRFKVIKIDVLAADKMTEVEKKIFVIKHFEG